MLALLIVVLTMLAPAARSALAEEAWAERRTEHLVLRYAPTDTAEIDWYAGFAEDAYRHVSDVFGSPPSAGIVVTFYSDEAAYAVVNPSAGREASVLGHAQPLTREIGLALWRLRRQSEGLRRDAVRHELTHIVLGELSDQKLPIGFHEGLAQYVEKDSDQRARFGRALQRASDTGQLLSLADLNRRGAFLSRAAVAYPQSYAIVHFLAEQYGLGHLTRMLLALREAPLEEAVQRAFGHSVDQLEAEWRASLPSFLDGGWRRNELDVWEMAEPRQLLVEGRYGDAEAGFERAARLFADLGRGEKLEQARGYLRQSSAGSAATTLSQQGALALDAHDYATAADLLGQAEGLWSVAGDDGRRKQIESGAEQARRGLEALDQLAQAQTLFEGWRLPEARTTALAAGMTFAELGDAARTDQANERLLEVQAFQARLGLAAIGGGALSLAALGLVWSLRQRPRRSAGVPYRPAPGLAQERDWSL